MNRTIRAASLAAVVTAGSVWAASCGGGSRRPSEDARTASDGGTIANDAALRDAGELGDAGLSEDAQRDAVVEPACPTISAGYSMGRVKDSELTEISGVVASAQNPGILWVHNDSGDRARVFAIRPSGETVSVVSLDGVRATDFEAIAIGVGSDGASRIFVGDIGDNDKARTIVSIHDFEEPLLGASPSETLSVSVRTTNVVYNGGAHNAEGMWFDPRDKSVWIVSKSLNGGVLFPIPEGSFGSSRVDVSSAGVVSISIATAADMSSDGQWIAIRGYFSGTIWPIDDGRETAEALTGSGCPLTLASEMQGESLGFAADGSGYYTISEGESARIFFYAFE